MVPRSLTCLFLPFHDSLNCGRQSYCCPAVSFDLLFEHLSESLGCVKPSIHQSINLMSLLQATLRCQTAVRRRVTMLQNHRRGHQPKCVHSAQVVVICTDKSSPPLVAIRHTGKAPAATIHSQGSCCLLAHVAISALFHATFLLVGQSVIGPTLEQWPHFCRGCYLSSGTNQNPQRALQIYRLVGWIAVCHLAKLYFETCFGLLWADLVSSGRESWIKLLKIINLTPLKLRKHCPGGTELKNINYTDV